MRLLPMLEVAFEHIQNYAENQPIALQIVGYYEIPYACKKEAVLSPFAQRIGDKISQNSSSASILVTMNNLKGVGAQVDAGSDGDSTKDGEWPEYLKLTNTEEQNAFDLIVDTLIMKKMHYELHDFDMWLDNPRVNDWANGHIQPLLAAYTVA